MEQQRQDPAVERGEQRQTARSARSLGLGAVLGAVLGGAIGLAAGAAFFGGAGVWAVAIAVTVAGALLGGFWGRYGLAGVTRPGSRAVGDGAPRA